MKVADGLFCDLRNGVQLAVWNTSGQLDLHAVCNFLADAVTHFKKHRDDLKTVDYAKGPYCQSVRNRKSKSNLGTMQLSVPSGQTLTAHQWTDAVIGAYCSAETVEQMQDGFPTWKDAVQRDGSPFLTQIITLLEQPNGGLHAMAQMIAHDLNKGKPE